MLTRAIPDPIHTSSIILLIGPYSIIALLAGAVSAIFALVDRARAGNFFFSIGMGTLFVLIFLSSLGTGYSGPISIVERTLPTRYDRVFGMSIALVFGLAFSLDALFAKKSARKIENGVLVALYGFGLCLLVLGWP